MSFALGRPRLTRLVPILGVCLLGFAFVIPAGGAIPASALVGRVTYVDISDTSDLTTSIRSFQLKVEMPSELQGKPVFGVPRVVQEVTSRSPWIMEAIATGIELPTITVTLYHPGTTTRFQQYTFTDTHLTLDQQTQNGPASATPQQVVTWSFDTIRQSTYATNGTTLVSTFCFDLTLVTTC